MSKSGKKSPFTSEKSEREEQRVLELEGVRRRGSKS